MLKDLKLPVQLCNHIPYVTKITFVLSSKSITTASMTVGDWITIRLVKTFMPCFLDDIGTLWILKPHGFKMEERSRSWLSRSGGLYSDGEHGVVWRWHWNMMDNGIGEECLPGHVGQGSVQLDMNTTFNRVVSGPCEWKANISKVNETTMVNGSAKTIHLACWP